MVKLFVAVVGTDWVTPVIVNGSDSIGELKEAIAAKLPHPVAAISLDLYCTYRNGEWLSIDSDRLMELQQSLFSDSDQYLAMKMHPASLVKDHFSGKLKPRTIHVLAVLPAAGSTRTASQMEAQGEISPSTRSPKRQELLIEWVPASDLCPRLPFQLEDDDQHQLEDDDQHQLEDDDQHQLEGDDKHFVRIPWPYLENSGVQGTQEGQDLWVYRRKALKEQWNEIQRDSIDAEAMLWIVGAPGAGKSCAAYAFACGVVDRSRWNVLWIHYDDACSAFDCVKFEGDVKSTCKLLTTSLSAETFDILLAPCAAGRNQLVFLDGFRKEDQCGYCRIVLMNLVIWQSQDTRHRRLVCVTSMASLGKSYKLSKYKQLATLPTIKPSRQNGEISLRSNMKFKLSSWTLEEYLAAVQHKEFFRSVMVAFEVAEDPGVEGRQMLVRDKHYVAGGSARAMFAYTTEDASAELVDALDAVSNLPLYVDGHIGGSSADAVNRLLAHYENGKGKRVVFRTDIVSEFAWQLLAVNVSPTTIINFAKLLNANPALDGHLFEAWVVASLAHCELEYRVQGSTRDPKRWKQCHREIFDPKKDVITDVDCYFVPNVWNQAGYDAVYIEPDVTTDDTMDDTTPRLRYIFLQITRSITHSFDAAPFFKLLHKLGRHKKNVSAVELWFVVPQAILSKFSTSEVDDLSFKKDVVDAAFVRSSRRSLPSVEVESRVVVVGVDYPYSQL